MRQNLGFIGLAISISLGLSTSFTPLAGADVAHPGMGSEGSGGGDPDKIHVAAIQFLLKGSGLKDAMLYYLRTLQVDQISEPSARATFARIMTDDLLQNDIRSSEYVLKAKCQDSYSPSVPASTKIGVPGAEICFDVKKVASTTNRLSEEDVMIKLASLAFHEHVHHFQDSAASIEQNEDDAYKLSAYVQVTAKFASTPVLKWQPSNDESVTDDSEYALLLRMFDLGSAPGWVTLQGIHSGVCFGETEPREPFRGMLGAFSIDATSTPKSGPLFSNCEPGKFCPRIGVFGGLNNDEEIANDLSGLIQRKKEFLKKERPAKLINGSWQFYSEGKDVWGAYIQYYYQVREHDGFLISKTKLITPKHPHGVIQACYFFKRWSR
jgi:hypothetical protein